MFNQTPSLSLLMERKWEIEFYYLIVLLLLLNDKTFFLSLISVSMAEG